MTRAQTAAAPFTLPALPWKESALAPIVSADAVNLHYGKHHKGYVDNLNRLVAGSPLSELPLDELVRQTAGAAGQVAIFNNAAQAWNHAFYWQSLAPRGGGRPTGALKTKINNDFGGYDAFREQFCNAAVGHFGSGWAWLALDGDRLRVFSTANADTPIVRGMTCLLTIDVWEHAYYLDYQNRRAAYVEAVVDKLLNWSFAAQQLEQAESEHLVR